MKKWKASTGTPRIVLVEVEKETQSSVWVNGQRKGKMTDYESYFDTWDEARFHLVSYFEKARDIAKRRLDFADASLSKANGLEKPAEVPDAQ